LDKEIIVKKEHHVEVERKLIHLMLKSRNVVDEMLETGVAPEYFDPIHQPLVQSIYAEFMQGGARRLLTRDSYRQHLIDSGARGDVVLSLTLYDKCLVGAYARPDDLGFLRKELAECYVARRSHFIFQEYADECKKAGYMKAAQSLQDKFNRVLGGMETRRTVFASVADCKEEYLQHFQQLRQNPASVVRCNYPEIDEAMAIGFEPQGLTLFVADVGGHKTNLMLNVSLSLVEQGHGVLFIPLEMNCERLINRMLANKEDIDGKLLANPHQMTDDQARAIVESKLWDQKLFYILDADERTKVSSLRMEIERRCMVFRPKVVVVDYADNLESDYHYGQRHIEIGDILKSLRFLGKKYGFHIVTAAQMGRAAIKALREGKEEAVDSTAIHGSHQYSADSDTIFFSMKVPHEPDKIKVLVLKARHGPSGHTFELRVDPAKYRIYSTHATHILIKPTDIDNIMLTPVTDIVNSSEGLQFGGDLDLGGGLDDLPSDDLAELG
jgi:replicative DNA helicase